MKLRLITFFITRKLCIIFFFFFRSDFCVKRTRVVLDDNHWLDSNANRLQVSDPDEWLSFTYTLWPCCAGMTIPVSHYVIRTDHKSLRFTDHVNYHTYWTWYFNHTVEAATRSTTRWFLNFSSKKTL